MSESMARWLVVVAGAYAAAGAVFALAFVTRGVQRVDPAARGAGWGFRVLILPGVAALWPWLALRWARGVQPRPERNAHRDAVATESAT